MFCLNELTVLLDTALQSTESPPTNSVTSDKHHACLASPNSAPHAQKGHSFFVPPPSTQ